MQQERPDFGPWKEPTFFCSICSILPQAHSNLEQVVGRGWCIYFSGLAGNVLVIEEGGDFLWQLSEVALHYCACKKHSLVHMPRGYALYSSMWVYLLCINWVNGANEYNRREYIHFSPTNKGTVLLFVSSYETYSVFYCYKVLYVALQLIKYSQIPLGM